MEETSDKVMSKKTIVLKPEFRKPEISMEEKIYNSIKSGHKSQRDIARNTGVRTGGTMSRILELMCRKGYILRRECECCMHEIYDIVK